MMKIHVEKLGFFYQCDYIVNSERLSMHTIMAGSLRMAGKRIKIPERKKTY
jgi:hypothetical protein